MLKDKKIDSEHFPVTGTYKVNKKIYRETADG